MGRKRRTQGEKKKKKGGMLMGMRGGFKKAASAVGVGKQASKKDAAEKKPRTRMDVFWNVVTIALLIATAIILLRRFGVIHF